MQGVRIDRADNSRFDLHEILTMIGERALESNWRCRDLWYIVKEEGSDDYWKAPRNVSGQELLHFAEAVRQVIDGRFEAITPGSAKKPWLVIKAVDSSYWEVWSSKPDVLQAVRTRFSEVADLTPTEGS